MNQTKIKPKKDLQWQIKNKSFSTKGASRLDLIR